MKHQRHNREGRSKIRVLIADDYFMERIGIRTVLREDSRMEIIGETDSGREIIEFVRTRPCDLLIIDIFAHVMRQTGIIRCFKGLFPKTYILAMGASNEEMTVTSLIRAGADGYFLKAEEDRELLRAADAVTQGRSYLSPSLREQFDCRTSWSSGVPPHESLSFRERQVMSLMSIGKTVTEISGELSLSVKTVSTYRSRIFEKLGISSNGHLIRYAIQHSLVVPTSREGLSACFR